MITLNIQKTLHGSQGLMNLAVNVQIEKGEFVALMGQSGSGKTTLLRILAGLEKAEGDVVVEGNSWQNLATQYREIGFIFQDYALFENMSVEENLLFVSDDKALASELLEITELTTLKERNVTGLSGGQKQRVSLCRAMMKKPKLLLMDEPLSALDPAMRKKLQGAIKILHKRFNITTIMVSHDVSEVFSLASRVLVLEQGKVIKDGTLQEILLKDESGHQAEVLALEEKEDKVIATVSLLGEILKIEVDRYTQVGQILKITIQGAVV